MTIAIINQKSLLRFRLSTRIWKTPEQTKSSHEYLQQAYSRGLIDRKPQDNSFVYRLFKETKNV